MRLPAVSCSQLITDQMLEPSRLETTCDQEVCSALGEIRTPNLLIRSPKEGAFRCEPRLTAAPRFCP